MNTIPEGQFADIGALRVHYHQAGPQDGPPVVFLHGSGPGASGWSNFQRNYERFAGAGFRAVVPDTIGYGYSSKPEGVDYTMEFLGECLVRFLDVLGIGRCALVGNSHGGALAIRTALDHPQRVSHLVLMAPGGLEEREVYMQMEGIQAMLQAVFQRGGIDRDGMQRVLGLQVHDPRHLDEDIIEQRLHIARQQPRRAIATLSVPHLAGRLGELSQPVLGLWGVHDKFCPVSGAMTLARGCQRAQVVLLSDCGHWVMVERAELFNRLAVDFLREGA